MFAYLNIERGLSWYKELLQLSLSDEIDLNINPRNCVGTVLSLTGHRKYFCMFHEKHTDSKRTRKPVRLDTIQLNIHVVVVVVMVVFRGWATKGRLQTGTARAVRSSASIRTARTTTTTRCCCRATSSTVYPTGWTDCSRGPPNVTT